MLLKLFEDGAMLLLRQDNTQHETLFSLLLTIVQKKSPGGSYPIVRSYYKFKLILKSFVDRISLAAGWVKNHKIALDYKFDLFRLISLRY